MNLLLLFLRLETKRLWRDRTLPLAFLLMTVFLAVAVQSGRGFVRKERAIIASAQTEEKTRILGLKQQIAELTSGTATQQPSRGSDPRLPSNVGRLGQHWAVKPPVSVMGTLAAGRNDLYPPCLPVSNRGVETLFGIGEIENPQFLLTGRFDPVFVLVFLFPLFLLALGYNLLSEERENGTLALLRAQSVPLPAVLGAKTTARWLLFALPVAVFAPTLLLLAGLFGGDRITGDTIVRLVLVTVLTACYGAFWLALCAGVNALRKDSATNVATLVGIWLLLTLIVPGALQEGAGVLFPVPSRIALIEATRKNSMKTTQQGNALLARYYEDHPELAEAAQSKTIDPKDFSARRAAVAKSVEQIVEPLIVRHDTQLRRQQEFTTRFSWLSPVITFASALEELAGSGAERQQRFETQVKRFREQWQEFFLPRVFARMTISVRDIESLPRFTFEEEAEGMVQGRALGVAFPVVGLTLLLGAAAARLLERRD
ncbi:MAG: DUF3526 domain-containing protein [Cytophagales bacterium]|nr:DUF3526 domain-containing protein [Armatimonadota bacterium]